MAFEGTLQDFTVNMHGPELEHTCIEVQQGDTASRRVRIHLKDFGGADFKIPYGATAVFCINKSDGYKVYDACEIEDESTVIVTLSNQAIACAGRQKAQIYLSKDGWDIKTQTFTVNVPRAIYTDDAIKSSDEFGILSELIAEYEAIVDSAGQSAVSAADSAAAAEAARQGIEESLGQISENKDNIAELKSDLDKIITKSNNLFYVDSGEIKNDGIITVKADETGSVIHATQNGQNSGNVYVVLKNITLEAGKTYTFSVNKLSGKFTDSGAINLGIYRMDTNASACIINFADVLADGGNKTATFTADYKSYYIQITYASTGTNKSYDCYVNLNLSEGSVADYSQYGYFDIHKSLPTIQKLSNAFDIVVSKDGSGDFTSLTDAVKNCDDKAVIFVKNGIYDNEIVKAWQKTVFIIGESREGVIIKNNTGAYATPPIEMGTGLLCNLTIYAENDGSLSSEPSSKGYALHSESSVTNYHKFVIENCTLKSDWRSSWGMGMRANMEYIIRNTDFEGVYFHDSEHSNSVGLQKIFFDVCNITKGLILQDQNMVGSTIDVRFNRCLVKAFNGSDITYYLWDAENTTVIQKNSLDDFPNWSLNNYSWGNSKAELNAIN